MPHYSSVLDELERSTGEEKNKSSNSTWSRVHEKERKQRTKRMKDVGAHATVRRLH